MTVCKMLPHFRAETDSFGGFVILCKVIMGGSLKNEFHDFLGKTN